MHRPSGSQVRKIQAAVLCAQGGPLKIESLELEGLRDDEILVQITASGICHTDISLCDGWSKADGPIVLGQEGAGIVARFP
jgi:aryl-alcohol dehydrogenase